MRTRFRPVKAVLNIFSCFFFGLVVLITVGVVFSVISGAKLYTVTTGSMNPTYPVGTVLYVEPVEFEELNEGDVITFKLSSDTVVTHRITGIDRKSRLLRTQGDNNKTEDASLVDYNNIVGKVKFGIPYIGYAVMVVRTKFGMIVSGVVIVCIVLFSVFIRLYNRTKENDDIDGNDKASGEQTEETKS